MPFTIANATIAQTLKAATTESHEALEAMVLPRLQAITSPQDYARLLKDFYGYFKPVEDAVAPFITRTILPDWAQRRKAHAILNDLAALQQPFDHLPLATALPSVNNLPQAMGALYVMEGSTLGGRGITKMLLKKEDVLLTIDHLQFFNGYGEATGPMWMAFVNVLNSFPFSDDEVAQLTESANSTFNHFNTWLQYKP